jgi:hypothetical protein
LWKLTEGQNGQLETHRVVLERSEEEHAITQDAPDENVCNNAWNQVRRVLVHRNSTDPVKGDKVPGQWSTDRADVNEARRGAMAEVGKRKVGEVDYKEQLSEPEVRAHPEMNEAKKEEVVGNVVTSNIPRSSHVNAIRGVERPRVYELENEEDESIRTWSAWSKVFRL